MKEEKSSTLMELMDQSTKKEPKVKREFFMEQTCENTTTVFWHLKEDKNKEDMFQQKKMINLDFLFQNFLFCWLSG